MTTDLELTDTDQGNCYEVMCSRLYLMNKENK
jgi:hypothetical protein